MPGMKLADGAFQILPVKVGINFGSGDAFMAQHFLHGAQVLGGLQHVAGETVAQHVRMHVHGKAGGAGRRGRELHGVSLATVRSDSHGNVVVSARRRHHGQ